MSVTVDIPSDEHRDISIKATNRAAKVAKVVVGGVINKVGRGPCQWLHDGGQSVAMVSERIDASNMKLTILTETKLLRLVFGAGDVGSKLKLHGGVGVCV